MTINLLLAAGSPEQAFDGDRLIRPRQRILDEQSTGHLLD